MRLRGLRLLQARELATLILLVLVVTFAGLREPRFLQAETLSSVFLWVPLLLVLGVGELLVIVTRGIDVSIGSSLGVAGIVAGLAFKTHHVSLAAGAGIALGVGLALGCLNGSAIAWAKVPPIVATLGTLSAFRGAAFLISGSKQVDAEDLPASLTSWSLAGPLRVFGVTIPWILVLSLCVAGAVAFLVRKTRLGRDIFALGSHPEAARLRGVPVGRTTFLVYALMGLLAGLGGLLYASRYGFVNPGTAGQGMELSVIAAVVVGGAKVTGGSGSVLGVLLGCVLLATINVALSELGIEANWQQLVYGAVILVALLTDAGIGRAAARWGVAR
jgi:rhamnose transport system permease protein